MGILSLLGGDLCLVCPNNLENSSSELLNKVGVSTFQLGKREREREAQNKKVRLVGLRALFMENRLGCMRFGYGFTL